MENLNEIIGIIKGISFDNVINKKEIIYLKNWVEKNRHFATSKEEIGLVNLIEKALDDNVITDLERRTILATSYSLLKADNNMIDMYSELNGIINGIISDNEVNDEEVINLKKWFDTHGLIDSHNRIELEIREVVNNVLSDGIITTEEKNRLLVLLTNRIETLEIENKINQLKTLIKRKKNIGIELISLLDNESYMNYIHLMSEAQLKHTLNSYSSVFVRDPEIVLISLSLIGMINYDGSFYESVRIVYQGLYNCFSEQKIEALIRTILNKYRTKEDKSTRSRIINIPLRQAIVPKYFLNSFFEFIYDIYKINFEFDLSDNLYDDFKYIYEGLNKTFQKEGNEITITATQKTYKLIQTTKDLIVKENDYDPLIRLSIIIIQLIDKKVWGKDIIVNNVFLKEAFLYWCSNYDKTENTKRIRKNNTWRSNWKPKFKLIDYDVYLIPPIHKIKANYDYHTIKYVVKNGNEVLLDEYSLDIREIIGGYQIKVPSLNVSKPLKEIRYLLCSKDEVIYDSKEQLYREFIVFNQEGNEISNNTDYKGEVVFCTSEKIQKTDCYYSNKYYFLSSSSVKYGDVYLIKDIFFNFTSLTKPGIFGEEWDNYSIVNSKTKDIIKVFKNVKYLVFEDEIGSFNYYVKINDTTYNISHFHTTITNREGVKKYIVDLKQMDPGIYSISVIRMNSNIRKVIFKTMISFDPYLNVTLEKINDKSFLVNINTGFVEDDIIKNINLDYFDIDYFDFNYHHEKYYYRIPLDIDMYRITNNTWKSLSEDLWIDDIKESTMLDVFGTHIDGIMVFSSKGNLLAENVSGTNKDLYKRFSIGFLLSYKMRYDFVSIFIIKNKIASKMIRCYNKCFLTLENIHTNYNSNDNIYTICSNFKGKNKIFYEIINQNGEMIYKSEPLDTDKEIRISNLNSFEKYTINVYEKTKGLMLEKKNKIATVEKMIYRKKDFVGHTFKISEVSYSERSKKNKIIEKTRKMNNVYLMFVKQEDEDIFIGKLFLKKNGKVLWFQNINPVEIEVNSELISDYLDIFITNEGDGLLYNTEKKRILNLLEKPNAPVIENYTVELIKEEVR